MITETDETQGGKTITVDGDEAKLITKSLLGSAEPRETLEHAVDVMGKAKEIHDQKVMLKKQAAAEEKEAQEVLNLAAAHVLEIYQDQQQLGLFEAGRVNAAATMATASPAEGYTHVVAAPLGASAGEGVKFVVSGKDGAVIDAVIDAIVAGSVSAESGTASNVAPADRQGEFEMEPDPEHPELCICGWFIASELTPEHHDRRHREHIAAEASARGDEEAAAAAAPPPAESAPKKRRSRKS